MDQINNEFICTYENCAASFKKRSKLKIHERTHTGERPFICDHSECGKKYTSSSHLKRHIDTVHSEVKQSYKCTICFLTLSNLTNFKRHQARIHVNGQKYPHQCKYCMQGFYKKSQLNEHIFSHTQIAPFTCSQCSEGFLKRSMLTKHQKKCHTEYPCPICKQILYRWSDLLQHKKIVHKKTEKLFKCEKCDKSFITKIALTGHIETHDTIRNTYICPKENCEREYIYKRNLRQHIKTFHEGRVFKCEIPNCDRVVQNKHNLLKHMKVHSKITNTADTNMKIKKVRAKRKDADKPRHSAIILLSGLVGTIPKHMEEYILKDNDITIDNLMHISTI